MSQQSFMRAGLIVVVTAYTAALYALFGWWRALVLAAIGLGGALLLAEDYTAPLPPPNDDPPPADRPRTDVDGHPRDFTRIRG